MFWLPRKMQKLLKFPDGTKGKFYQENKVVKEERV